MATDNKIAIKLTLLADGIKQGLADVRQGLDDLRGAGAGAGGTANADATKNLGGIEQSAKQSETAIKTVSSQVDAAKSAVLGFFAVSGGVELIRSIVNLSDTYNALRAKIKEAAGENANYAAISARLFNIAQASAAPLEDTVNLYARTASALKNTGASQETILKLTEAVGLSFKASGSSAAEASSTITQLTQAISTDTVQWEDFGQLADTNIRLVNIAAKNLGFDGIGSMKKAMSESKVTNVQLVNALVSGFGEIKKSADKMPVSFRGSMTMLSNAFTKLIGESSDTTSIVGKLSSGIQFLAENIKPVVAVVTVLAEMYGTKLVLGFIESTKQIIEAKKAVEEKTEADKAALEVAQGTLQSEVRIANIRVQTTTNLLEEARLQRSLAVTAEQRAASIQDVSDALAAQANAQRAANEAQARLDATTNATSTPSVSRYGAALDKLKKATSMAFTAKIAVDGVGAALESLGEYNEKIRFYRYAWEATLEELKVLIIHFTSGEFLDKDADPLRKQFEAIQQKYGDLAAAASDSSLKITADEEKKTKAVEKATLEQKASLEKSVKAMTELTASWDAQLENQTKALETHLATRAVAMDASDVGDGLRSLQKLAATINSYKAEYQLYQTAATAKLGLVDAVYQQEIAKQKAGSDRANELEQASMNERKAIYSQLAEHYSAVLDKLQQAYNQEITAAAEAKRNLRALATDHEFALADIERQGMGVRTKIRSEESEFDAVMAKAKQELAKGENANQEKLNGLLERAKSLHGELTSEVISAAKTEEQKSQARWEAADRLNAIYGVQKTALENNSKDHVDNAAVINAQMKPIAATLEDVTTKLAEMNKQLNADKLLTIGVNDKAVLDAIAEISKPTSSTHTIDVIENRVQAHATGGYITSYQNVRGYANGGQPIPMEDFKRKQGLVVGKGTGTSDEVPAMLSNGEGVLTAKAMSRIGVGALNDANAGNVDLVPVKNYAIGGVAGDDKISQKIAEMKKQQFTQVAELFDSQYLRWVMDGTTSGALDPASSKVRFESHAGDYLRANGLPHEFLEMYLKNQSANQVLKTTNSTPRDKAKAQLSIDNQFAAPASPTAPTVVQTPALPTSVAAPTLSAPAPLNFPTVSPPNFAMSSAPKQQTGVTHTIKLQTDTNKQTSVMGNSEAVDFFKNLETISGVTKL